VNILFRVVNILSFFVLCTNLIAQVANDDCVSATPIPNTNMFCSGGMAYSNVGAIDDIPYPNSCLNDFTNGVWFSFRPFEPTVNIEVHSYSGLGTIMQPSINLFTGSCDDLELIDCAPGLEDRVTLLFDGLNLGAEYYIFVESPEGLEGTFELCVSTFVAPPNPEADCSSAVVLCDKSSFSIPALIDAGQNPNELDDFCIGVEFASTWYTWTCEMSGTLEMTISPNFDPPGEPSDDIDFVIFELPNGLDDCANKQELLCMASGANQSNGITDPFDTWDECDGPTGLMAGDGDSSEDSGCQSGNNNFLMPLNMVAGRSYAIVIMNFDRSGQGVSIEFGGTGTFQGPQPDFAFELETGITVLECDREVIFTDLSTTETDAIVEYIWNFGGGAEPAFATGVGPHLVTYDSFGNKFFSLTITSANGCQTTEIKEVFIERCCDELENNLTGSAIPSSLLCPDMVNGEILADGDLGFPPYMFSINGTDFQSSPLFTGLSSGAYDVFVEDTKGCIYQTSVTLTSAVEITLDAGDDVTVNLGDTIMLDAMYEPDLQATISWDPPNGILDCTDCLNPQVQAPGTTTYTLTLIDENDCEYQDDLTITTIVIKDVYQPNIFNPTDDGLNDTFTLGFGSSVVNFLSLRIYDRWGNLIFQQLNLPLNDLDTGWNGMIGSDLATPGIYAYVAEVEFLNGDIDFYKGSLTLVR